MLIAFLVNLLLHPWIQSFGDTLYLRFLRSEWVLVASGKGLHLDFFSLPLPPILYALTATITGPSAAETLLPVLINTFIMLVLVARILQVYPLKAKLLGATLLLDSPFYYLLQQQLDLQVFVLLLGVQLTTLRAFRLQPTVARMTWAIAANILISLVSFAAAIALLSAVAYLFFIANYRITTRPMEVNPAAWVALLWVYVPFSLSGYLLWLAYWAIAGSNLKTSYFLDVDQQGSVPTAQNVFSTGSTFAVLLLIVLALVLLMGLLWSTPETRMRGDRTQTVGWIVLMFSVIAAGLLGLQLFFQALPLRLEVLAASFSLLVPAAIASTYGQMRNIFQTGEPRLRIFLIAVLTVVATAFSLEYLLGPQVLRNAFPGDDSRAVAGRAAGTEFSEVDPGGRILLDPRFTPTFVLSAGIDPNRLLTPFDEGFEQFVTAPPSDVDMVVVTDSLDDRVAGNYPAMRLLDFLPNGTLLAEGSTSSFFLRAFESEHYELPTENLERSTSARYAEAEERLLEEVSQRLGSNMLPTRPDGWAYAVDVGNLLLYAAERGDAKFLSQVDETIHEYYLITEDRKSVV